MNNLYISTGLISIFALLGCTNGSPQDNGNDETGLPNPASVYCKNNGGTLEIREDEQGNQNGVCIFADGSECDEWAYYRGECNPGSETSDDQSDTGVGLANPASTNCVENGGTLKIVDEPDGQVGICTLPGGVECEEWALFRGECGAD